MAIQKCAKGTCFSMTGAPKCAHSSKTDPDTVVLKLLDTRDPADAARHQRDLVSEFWADAGALARARYAGAAADRHYEAALRGIQELRLQRAIRAAHSYGSGAHVPPAQIYRLRGVEFPV